MRQRIKKWGCYAIIIVLLPYVITVFLNGPGIEASSHVDQTCVKVRITSGDEEESENAAEGENIEEKETAERGEGAGVVKMPIAEYCIGVLAREIPVDYEKEALKAQAILVRTDVYKKIKEDGSNTILEEPFWTQKKMEQAWGIQYSKKYYKLEQIWEETEGQVLVYNDELAYTPFFRLSNGCTRDGEEALGSDAYPYLKIVDCPDDIESEEQIQTLVMDDMEAEVAAVDSAGYVTNVRVGQENISGEEFRKTYNLKSGCFTLQRYNGKMRITTRGIGHGIGMSQYSANQMAKKGDHYQEILNYFFEGTEIKEVAEILLETE